MMKITRPQKPVLCALVAVAVTLTGCADDPNRNTQRGALAGAVLGGVLGNQVSHAKGAPIVGAAIGALAGGSVGHYMDKQRQEMEQQLAQESKANELQITTMSDGSLKVGIAGDVSFDVDSATIKPQYLDTYAKIATILKSYDKTVIHVVGHTDSTGSDEHNMALSQRRAQSVGSYLISQGVDGSRVREEGRGESEPVASNDTVDGRARNRRVDIVIKPIVQGQEQKAWDPPPYLGS